MSSISFLSSAFQSVKVATPTGRTVAPSLTANDRPRSPDVLTIGGNRVAPNVSTKSGTYTCGAVGSLKENTTGLPHAAYFNDQGEVRLNVTPPSMVISASPWEFKPNSTRFSDILDIKGAKEIPPSSQTEWNDDRGCKSKAVLVDGKILEMFLDEENRIVGLTINGKPGWLDKQEDKIVIYAMDGGDYGFRYDFNLRSESKNGAIGMFEKAENPYAALGKLLGMKGDYYTKETLLASLESVVADESSELQNILSGKLREAGMGNVSKKITFSEDKKGNIVIEGNLHAKQKKKLARLINDDPKLVERIKTQKARMEMAEELQRGRVDLSDQKFDAARTHLLNVFLKENDLTIEEAIHGGNAKYQELWEDFSELSEEVLAYVGRQYAPKPTEFALFNNKSESTHALLAMKRGELSEATDTDEEPDFHQWMSEIRRGIQEQIIDKYNAMFEDEPEKQIDTFDIKIDSDRGAFQIIDVKTASDDPHINAFAEGMVNGWRNNHNAIEGVGALGFLIDEVESFAVAVFAAHDDEHGDVKEFKHEIITSNGRFEIFSPEADKAALKEVEVLSKEIGTALGNFFGKTMGIENPFEIQFGAEGLLSMTGLSALTREELQVVQKALSDVNRYLLSGEDTKGTMSPELLGIADKLLELKEAQDKVHDKSLLPKEGIRFAI